MEVIDESSKVIKGGGGGSAAVREALSFTGTSSPPAPAASGSGGEKKPAVGQRKSFRGTWTTNAASGFLLLSYPYLPCRNPFQSRHKPLSQCEGCSLYNYMQMVNSTGDWKGSLGWQDLAVCLEIEAPKIFAEVARSIFRPQAHRGYQTC